MKSSTKLLQILAANELGGSMPTDSRDTRQYYRMTQEDFGKYFPVIANHLNSNTGWTNGDGPGCLFETFGEEHAFIRQQDPHTVWTLLDGDGNKSYLQSGYHFVNRLGYLVSTRPVPDGVHIEVRLSC